ncbi:hypothetical protein ACJBU6_06749 [Exserohilum turcicum]
MKLCQKSNSPHDVHGRSRKHESRSPNPIFRKQKKLAKMCCCSPCFLNARCVADDDDDGGGGGGGSDGSGVVVVAAAAALSVSRPFLGGVVRLVGIVMGKVYALRTTAGGATITTAATTATTIAMFPGGDSAGIEGVGRGPDTQTGFGRRRCRL